MALLSNRNPERVDLFTMSQDEREATQSDVTIYAREYASSRLASRNTKRIIQLQSPDFAKVRVDSWFEGFGNGGHIQEGSPHDLAVRPLADGGRELISLGSDRMEIRGYTLDLKTGLINGARSYGSLSQNSYGISIDETGELLTSYVLNRSVRVGRYSFNEAGTLTQLADHERNIETSGNGSFDFRTIAASGSLKSAYFFNTAGNRNNPARSPRFSWGSEQNLSTWFGSDVTYGEASAFGHGAPVRDLLFCRINPIANSAFVMLTSTTNVALDGNRFVLGAKMAELDASGDRIGLVKTLVPQSNSGFALLPKGEVQSVLPVESLGVLARRLSIYSEEVVDVANGDTTRKRQTRVEIELSKFNPAFILNREWFFQHEEYTYRIHTFTGSESDDSIIGIFDVELS